MTQTLPLLGAHMSIAGGYYKAPDAAGKLGMGTCQIFTKNNNQWRAKAISDEDVSLFRASIATHNIAQPIAHSSYLINLGSGNDVLWKRSVEGFVEELRRAEQLGLKWVVTHPGASGDRTEAEGLAAIIRGLDEALSITNGLSAGCLLETTAGQGSSLGWRFEHLAEIIAASAYPHRLGVCVDTCHIFAAGYRLHTEAEYRETIAELDRIVGLDRVKAFHVNDSKRERGSRVDRHAHIGRGQIGLEPFRYLLNDSRFAGVPMYLETRKETIDGEEMDAVNLRTLIELASGKKSVKSGKPAMKRAAKKKPIAARAGAAPTAKVPTGHARPKATATKARPAKGTSR